MNIEEREALLDSIRYNLEQIEERGVEALDEDNDLDLSNADAAPWRIAEDLA